MAAVLQESFEVELFDAPLGAEIIGLDLNRPLSERLFALHRWLGIAIAAVAAIHIGAALQHHFVRRDRVLMRMLTG